MTYDFKEKIEVIDGVEVDYLASKIDTSMIEGDPAMKDALGQEQSLYYASFDTVAAMLSGRKDSSAMAKMIAVVRGKAEPGPLHKSLARDLERSKSRKESFWYSVELGKLIPAGTPPLPVSRMSMGFGRHKGGLMMRISVSK